MKIAHILLSSLIFLASSSPLYAAARSWEVDKAHSGFYFQIKHIFSKVHGFFNDFDVKMQFDKDNPAASSMVFTIMVDSIDTNIEQRNTHLLSPDFFEAEKYPTMKFTSTSISKIGENTYEVTGKFEVKGATYDLTFPLTYEGMREHPMVQGKEVIGFNGGLTIDRLAYKVGNGQFVKAGIVGKDVDIAISLELLADQ
ncbi:YceI family protein [Desulfogranum japonicum]|uniref:YceI family protein n=1 Tax=Desulfogranum japonicum TaxID=231447 RepID=UPI0003FD6C73|nr:YceI family protein [Desulfogranum japonicum]